MAPPRVLVIVAPRGFREEELEVPVEAWSRSLAVTITSTRRGVARGMAGASFRVAASLSDLPATLHDGVFVLGGAGAPEHLWDNCPVHEVLRRNTAAGRLAGGICYGVVALARAGLLAGRRATVYPDRRAELEIARGGGLLVDEAVVVDGSVVTARGPGDASLFARTILTQLGV